MTTYERAVFAAERLWNRVNWRLWRRRRQPDAMTVAALKRALRWGCRACGIPDEMTEPEYEAHQRFMHPYTGPNAVRDASTSDAATEDREGPS